MGIEESEWVGYCVVTNNSQITVVYGRDALSSWATGDTAHLILTLGPELMGCHHLEAASCCDRRVWSVTHWLLRFHLEWHRPPPFPFHWPEPVTWWPPIRKPIDVWFYLKNKNYLVSKRMTAPWYYCLPESAVRIKWERKPGGDFWTIIDIVCQAGLNYL